MNKIYTVIGFLVLIGWSSVVNAQYFNDSIVISAGNRNFSWCSTSNDFIFVSDQVNDSIYVISIATHSIVASIKTHADIVTGAWGIKFSKNKIIINVDDYSVEMYDASDIFNITYLQTLGGFDQGWLESDPDDTTYFYWMEHWAQKIRIIDFSTGTMVTQCNPSTDGNVQGASRIGNMLYTGNAYNGSKRIDITNPAAPVITDFGGPAVYVACSNNYILYVDYFYGNIVSLLDQSGNVLATKSPVGLGIVTRDNLAFVQDNLTTWNLYNIQNGSFEFITIAPRGFNDYNDNYWIGRESSKLVLYPRNHYTISTTSNPSNGGTTTGGGNYNYGTVVTVNAYQNSGYSFINWTENGSQVSTNSSYIFTVSNNRTIDANFQLNIGIDETAIGYKFFPNPTTGLIQIQSPCSIVDIVIINSIGEQVMSKRINNSNFALDLSKNSKGVYFIKMTTGEKVIIHKVVLF